MIDEQTVQKLIDKIAALEEKVAFLSRMEQITGDLSVSNGVVYTDSNKALSTDADFTFNPSVNRLTVPEIYLGIGSTGSGDNTYLSIRRSADTGGTVSIDAFRSGVGGTTLLLNKTFGSAVDIYQEAWVAPTLLNSWVNYGGGYNNAGYFKDSLGIVHLRGLIKDGTATGGTTLFTLPVGYRPAARELFNAQSNGALGRIDVTTVGTVSIQMGSNAWISLDGLTFKAA